FVGKSGNFIRTDKRADFSLEPVGATMLDKIIKSGKSVLACGKIVDIFSGRGISDYNHTVDNMKTVDATIDYIKKMDTGLVFSNLVEFDMLYGHRRDPAGYARALKDFDRRLPEIMDNLGKEDLLVITADHGCDPTYKGTDHTREYVPLLVTGRNIKKDYNLGIRSSFSDLAATITELLNVETVRNGESFAEEIM
ncbi:MAG: phosphopentomutase, partial [Halanaerobiales bacterium]